MMMTKRTANPTANGREETGWRVTTALWAVDLLHGANWNPYRLFGQWSHRGNADTGHPGP